MTRAPWAARATVAAFRGLCWLLSPLPINALRGIARLAGRVVFRLDGRAVRTTRINLAIAYPDESDAFRERLAEESICQTAMVALEAKDYGAALRHVQRGIDRIERFLGEWEGEGEVMDEECPELTFLTDWYEELEKERPLSQQEQLERDLNVAVEAENFEEAARLRDKLRTLRPAFLAANPERSSSTS